MRFHRYMSIAIIATFTYTLLFCALVHAFEVKRPNVKKKFSEKKESKIQAIKSLSTKQAFEALKDVEFLVNRDFSYKAIYTAFKDRKSEAISQAQNYLKLRLIEVDEGRRIVNVLDFNIAKKIFEVFPDEATPILTNLYDKGDAVTRGNIVLASGNVSGGEAIKDMLIKALNDKSIAEEETPDMLGEPLRVCDIAYNQIVFRSGARNVLRTIGTAHKMEIRDYHINVLRGHL